MKFEYNAWDEKHKSPFGAVKKGTKINFSVSSDADSVLLLGFKDKIQMNKNGEEFTASAVPSMDSGLVFYSFEAVYNGAVHTFGRSNKGAGAAQGGEPFQLTVHDNSENPEWFSGKVMYQIYTDRFFKGSTDETRVRDRVLLHSSWDDKPVYIKNDKGEVVVWDFFGGNLDGVIKKLGYLKSLGVDIIYLNPIFESVSNHKYDTADYNEIDRMYGTTKTLGRLVNEAKKLGISIMLDGVFSHTGADSIYFNKYKNYGSGGAYCDLNSKYSKWYHFEHYPEKYACWWGVESLPSVDELNPSFLDYMLNEQTGAVIKWMKQGIAGWRLDVADELPDEFIKKLKEAIIKVNPEAVLLGEVWEDASSKVSYGQRRQYILSDSLDSVSNYPLRDSLIALLTKKGTTDDFADTVMTLQENYPGNVFRSLMNMTGTHDTVRLMSLLGGAPSGRGMSTWDKRDYELPKTSVHIAFKRLEAYFITIFTLPGNPCIYYGDEIALQGYEDPYNRGTYDWDSQQKQFIELIKKLSGLRKELGIGNSFVRFKNSGRLLAYELRSGERGCTVYINTEKQPAKIASGEEAEVVFAHNAAKDGESITVEEYGAVVLKSPLK